jgi:hypothetical protein
VLNVSAICDMAGFKPIIHFRPYLLLLLLLLHVTIDI